MIRIKELKKIKITVIGGCAKFPSAVDNIDYIVPSVSELLIPNFVDSEYMTSSEWEEKFFRYEKNFNFLQKKQWLAVMEGASKKYNLWKRHKEYFWPDGVHVNRAGIKILYQQLKSLWFSE